MDALKDLYSEDFFNQFIPVVEGAYPSFNRKHFLDLIYDEEWGGRELKQRIRHVANALTQTLPTPYEKAIDVLKAVAPKCRGFEYLFLPEFVEINGLEQFQISISALEVFTRSSSAEFAVRPFLLKYPDRMMAQMLEWSKHDDEHLRRLASEGCRPRLPWGIGLQMYKINPAPILPILDALKTDPSEYVRKSVANNLNDISKDHPRLVLELAREWYGHHPHTDWIVRHACRTLLKQGHPEALDLFGLGNFANIETQHLVVLTPELVIGEDLRFAFELLNASSNSCKLRLEYEIGHVRKNGSLSLKRFRLSEKDYSPGRYAFTKKHSFKPITTRVYYPGQHQLNIIVNGRVSASASFVLVGPIQ